MLFDARPVSDEPGDHVTRTAQRRTDMRLRLEALAAARHEDHLQAQGEASGGGLERGTVGGTS